jgi:hypothetical protein
MKALLLIAISFLSGCAVKPMPPSPVITLSPPALGAADALGSHIAQ